MKTKVCSLILLLAMLITMGGCHGAEVRNTFAVPEEFDTSRNYEISFWAKNDTNMTQVGIYKDAIAAFQEMKEKGYGMLLTSTQADEEAQHFYRKLGYKDCGGFVPTVPGYEQPMELFLEKAL